MGSLRHVPVPSDPVSTAGSEQEGSVADALAAAHDALARHDWQGAYDAASQVASPDGDRCAEAARLDLLAEAAWWLGRMDECIERREAAFLAFDECGEDRRAGQCAVWLYEHHCFRAQPSIGGAWLRRARQRLDGDAECTEYGNLVLREAEAAHGRGDLDLAAEHAPADDRARTPAAESPTSRPRRCRRWDGCWSTWAGQRRGWATSTRPCSSPSRAGSVRTRPARSTAA